MAFRRHAALVGMAGSADGSEVTVVGSRDLGASQRQQKLTVHGRVSVRHACQYMCGTGHDSLNVAA